MRYKFTIGFSEICSVIISNNVVYFSKGVWGSTASEAKAFLGFT